MEIVVVGPAQIEVEFRQKFSAQHEYIFATDYNQMRGYLKNADVVFDFFLYQDAERLKLYQDRAGLIVFCQAVNIALAELVFKTGQTPMCTLFGFNGWTTFINRPYLEVTLWQEQDKEMLLNICRQLQTEYLQVDDRVGMVTPRVISMIINEAYYTLQEGTATAADIDLAMKLGTNYPYGPFEWAAKIGIQNIYEVLLTVYQDTRDERYKICPLLKKEYLKAGTGTK